MFGGKSRDVFGVRQIESDEMDSAIKRFAEIYHGRPDWLSDNVKTINFARFVCQETAKLTTRKMSVTIEGDSERVKKIQKQIDDALDNIRPWVEFACAYGTIILKPNGRTVDCMLPSDYMVTEADNGKIRGCVFLNQYVSEDKKTWYTRLEYHRFIGDVYQITNKCYEGKTKNDITKPIDIKNTKWNGLQEEEAIGGIDTPLFGVLKMPSANNIDMDSPLSLSIFSDAIEELKDLDVAYSRNAAEIYESKRITLVDQDRLLYNGKPVRTVREARLSVEQMDLPDFVRMIGGSSDGQDMYQEINPTLQTDARLVGINSLLSQIGFKCGFSNGYFVFNQSTGFATATQVTADQARTIQLIDDIRGNLDTCIIDIVKAINVFEDLYGTTGHVDFTDSESTSELDRQIHVHFEPIYTNAEEDRMRALTLANSGYYPKWYYLHMYEGLSEEDAKALTVEAQPSMPTLFAE